MKTLCIIAHSPGVTHKLAGDLERIFGPLLRVVPWALDLSATPPLRHADMYLTSFPSVYETVSQKFATDKRELSKVVLAHRMLSPVHFNKLLALPQGTRVLIAGNSKLACTVLLQAMEDFGVTHLDVSLHYPMHLLDADCGIRIAVVTGINKIVPNWVDTVIDVGVKDLALTTYSDIIQRLGLPQHILDEISKQYTIPIFDVTKNYCAESQKINAILQCVEDAVFTIDEMGFIDVCNNSAQCLTDLHKQKSNSQTALLHIADLFPNLDMDFPLQSGIALHDVLSEHDGQHYILRLESMGEAAGAVILAKKASRVQELEGLVRHELRSRGNSARYTFDDIMTGAPAMQQTVEVAKRFAKTRATILLEGESGVGKELFAHAIHAASERAGKPFVAINLAAMPEHLAESELFGYMDGAFTGAKKGGRRGLFEEAHQGTIFLDEVGDAPLPLQSKLLRVLEEQEVRRVGGMVGIPVDVRVVAATNRSLETMVKANEFRVDLFYRLCACPLAIPPLRERRDDVFLLTDAFAFKCGRTLRLAPEVRAFFATYTWPGNVRELQNVVNYMLNIVRGSQPASMDVLPRYLSHTRDGVAALSADPIAAVSRSALPGARLMGAGGPSKHLGQREQARQGDQTEQPARAGQNPEDVFEAVFARYRLADGGIERAAAVLACLKDFWDNGVRTGRSGLLDELTRRGTRLSVHRLRTCLRRLAEDGFVLIGATRQGSAITPDGLHFLERIAPR